jgi:ribosomal protein S27AE
MEVIKMSQNSERKILREKEKDKLKEIRNTYNRKPKEICPKCHKKSLFMTNSKNEVYCIRCNNLVAIKK